MFMDYLNMSEAAITTQTNSSDCEQPVTTGTDNNDVGGNTAGLNAKDIAALNERYHSLNFEQRLYKLYTDFLPEKVMVTSSFAATSLISYTLFRAFVLSRSFSLLIPVFIFPRL